MKNLTVQKTLKQQLFEINREIRVTENKISFTSEPKLIDALSFELLSLKARLGYLIDIAKQDI